MPAGDIIFIRLRSATDVEIEALAKILGVGLTGDREVNINDISKSIRSICGNSIANLRRSDHELPYREILKDVAMEATKRAGWAPCEIPQSSRDEWIEEYIYQVMIFSHNCLKTIPSEPERASTQEFAQNCLNGNVGVSFITSSDKRNELETVRAMLVNPVLGVFPIVSKFAAAKLLSHSFKKLGPAVFSLIHIRKRLEVEDLLKAQRG